MGGLLGGLSDLLFGKPEVPEANWGEMAKLLELGIDKNRYNQTGLFTNHAWDADKENLTQSINPELQPAMDNLLARVNAGTPGYDRAGQYRGLMDALLSRDRPYATRAAPAPRNFAMGPRPDLPERMPVPRPEFRDRPTPYRPASSVMPEWRELFLKENEGLIDASRIG